jgi:hypothetical protein
MADTTKISNAAATAEATAFAALLNGGTLEIRTAAQPATVDTADAGTLLAVLTFPNPAAASVTDGVVTFGAITADSSANATGTAAHFRAKGSGGGAIWDGSVGTSGATLNLNSVAISSGAEVSVTSLTYTRNKG